MNDEPIFENAYVAMKEVGNKWVAVVCVEDKTNKTEPNKNYDAARAEGVSLALRMGARVVE